MFSFKLTLTSFLIFYPSEKPCLPHSPHRLVLECGLERKLNPSRRPIHESFRSFPAHYYPSLCSESPVENLSRERRPHYSYPELHLNRPQYGCGP